MKKQLREKIKEQRKNLSKEFIEKNSEIIKNTLFNLEQYKKARSILFYVSFNNEVDTLSMIEEALEEKEVAVPVTQENDIIPSKLTHMKDLDSENQFNIKEPSKIKEIKNIDLIIIPGLAFDKKGNRLGFGKGYYDKFLKESKATKIGLCFDYQLHDSLPAEEHDVEMDLIITENQIL